MYRWHEETWETGEVLAPIDWLSAMAPLVEEFNGGLTAINLPEESLTAAHVMASACHALEYVASTSSRTISGDSAAWQDVDECEVEIVAETDGVIEADWCGSWRWDGTYPTDSFDDEVCVAWRLLIDGIDVDCSPLHNMYRWRDGTAMTGVLPVSQGRHTVTVQCRLYHQTQNIPPKVNVTLFNSTLTAHLRTG